MIMSSNPCDKANAEAESPDSPVPSTPKLTYGSLSPRAKADDVIPKESEKPASLALDMTFIPKKPTPVYLQHEPEVTKVADEAEADRFKPFKPASRKKATEGTIASIAHRLRFTLHESIIDLALLRMKLAICRGDVETQDACASCAEDSALAIGRIDELRSKPLIAKVWYDVAEGLYTKGRLEQARGVFDEVVLARTREIAEDQRIVSIQDVLRWIARLDAEILATPRSAGGTYRPRHLKRTLSTPSMAFSPSLSQGATPVEDLVKRERADSYAGSLRNVNALNLEIGGSSGVTPGTPAVRSVQWPSFATRYPAPIYRLPHGPSSLSRNFSGVEAASKTRPHRSHTAAPPRKARPDHMNRASTSTNLAKATLTGQAEQFNAQYKSEPQVQRNVPKVTTEEENQDNLPNFQDHKELH